MLRVTGPTKVCVQVIDSGIDESDGNARAVCGRPERVDTAPYRWRADERDAAGCESLVSWDDLNLRNAWQVSQFVDSIRWNMNAQGVGESVKPPVGPNALSASLASSSVFRGLIFAARFRPA